MYFYLFLPLILYLSFSLKYVFIYACICLEHSIMHKDMQFNYKRIQYTLIKHSFSKLLSYILT